MIVPGTFRAAVEANDLDALTRTLDPAIEFHSPVMVRSYRGRDAVSTLMRVLTDTFEDFHYTHDLVGTELPRWPGPAGDDPSGGRSPDGALAQALVFNARVMGKSVQGLDLLTFNREGLVADLTVMVRPLPAAMTLARAVGRRMEEL
ncbi:nuclear transport factor 2 family protein, partial [Actinomadura adrarensis]